MRDEEVKLAVIGMRASGESGAEIGRHFNISPRAVQEFLARDTWKEWWEEYDEDQEEYLSGKGYYLDLAMKLKEDVKKVGTVSKEIRKKDSGEDNSRILLISDMHIPYHHKDTIAFLQHLKAKYNPTRIICLGDELDKHALSFHDSDPDLPSAGDELRLALPIIAQLKEIFPVMDILESNHGSLLYRKANHHGIPRQYLKTYNEVLNVDENWKWWYDMTITLPDGNKCYLHHGKSANITKTSQTMSMCAVAGHYHEQFKIEYWGNPNGLFWGVQAGCLIDDSVYAFNYNNCNLKRPIIGTGLIINSQPVLEPMVLDVNGRWIDR